MCWAVAQQYDIHNVSLRPRTLLRHSRSCATTTNQMCWVCCLQSQQYDIRNVLTRPHNPHQTNEQLFQRNLTSSLTSQVPANTPRFANVALPTRRLSRQYHGRHIQLSRHAHITWLARNTARMSLQKCGIIEARMLCSNLLSPHTTIKLLLFLTARMVGQSVGPALIPNATIIQDKQSPATDDGWTCIHQQQSHKRSRVKTRPA